MKIWKLGNFTLYLSQQTVKQAIQVSMKTLNVTLNEKDVENTYRQTMIRRFKNSTITSPFGCDGFLVSNDEKIRCLLEFKFDVDFLDRKEVLKVIAQSIFYIKKFYAAGVRPSPSTIFIGDKNECFALHVNDVIDYLHGDYDWSLPPSSAHRDIQLMSDLFEDTNINPFVFRSENFNDCLDKLKELTDNIKRRILVTDKNITEVFKYFEDNVMGKTKLSTNELANLFVQLLVNNDDNYLHPSGNRKMLVTASFGSLPIKSRNNFENFFGHFSSSYSPKQKQKLTSVVDRLVEDTTRRKQGEFFTPTIWVDKAHEYIASVYGADWREKYVVWDPASGTSNLTRDYQFKELYVSTLNQSDIDTANQMGYNPEAVKFQYDFLNDGIEELPQGLRDAIESGREIIILMNPPYATNVEHNTKEGTHKSGTSNTKVRFLMQEDNIGRCTEQLYAQFLYKIANLNTNVHICMFTPPLFLSGNSYDKFRKFFSQKYDFAKGFVMDAANFADVKSWGLSFSIFNKKSL